MNEKGFSIYDTQQKFWFKIDRIVRNMNIVSIVEPVFNHTIATTFSSKESAQTMITEIEKEGNYDISNAEIVDIDAYEQKQKEEKEAKEKEMVKSAWENTDDDTKNKIISQSISSGNIDALKEFLGNAGIDTTSINEENVSTSNIPTNAKKVAELFGIDTTQPDWKEKFKEVIDKE